MNPAAPPLPVTPTPWHYPGRWARWWLFGSAVISSATDSMREKFLLLFSILGFVVLCWVSLVRNASALDRLPEARLEVGWGAGQVSLRGELPDEVTKAQVATEATRLAGTATLVNLLTVGSQDVTPGWLATVAAALRSAGPLLPAGKLVIDRRRLVVVGAVPDATSEERVLAALRRAAGSVLVIQDDLQVLASAAPVAADRSLGEAQKALLRVLTENTIEFEPGSTVLTVGGRAVLEQVLPVLQSVPAAKVAIGGHTDTSGTYAENVRLSSERANAVKNYLTARGVAAARLTAQGFGPMRPIADNGNAEGRKRNRRIEITLGSS